MHGADLVDKADTPKFRYGSWSNRWRRQDANCVDMHREPFYSRNDDEGDESSAALFSGVKVGMACFLRPSWRCSTQSDSRDAASTASRLLPAHDSANDKDVSEREIRQASDCESADNGVYGFYNTGHFGPEHSRNVRGR